MENKFIGVIEGRSSELFSKFGFFFMGTPENTNTFRPRPFPCVFEHFLVLTFTFSGGSLCERLESHKLCDCLRGQDFNSFVTLWTIPYQASGMLDKSSKLILEKCQLAAIKIFKFRLDLLPRRLLPPPL